MEVNVDEVNNSSDAIKVNIMDKSEILGHLPFGLDSLNTSMAWGGKGIYDWAPEKPKVMFLRHDDDVTAMHEFGHFLGLGDAYSADWLGPGVDYNKYPDASGTAMASGSAPTNNDIEMVILAFATGNRQNYQKQFSRNNISEALGKGN